MKVFMTGATGFIGQAVTRELIKKGWDVTALVRRPDSPQGKAVTALGAQVIQGDILNLDSMQEPMRGADIVIHNAAMYEYGVAGEQKQRMTDINVTGTDNVLSLAMEHEIPRTIYISTTLSFGVTPNDKPIDETFVPEQPFPNHYAQTKTEAHELAMEYQKKGLPLITVCPNAVIGPNDHSVFGYFLRMYINGLMTPFAWDPSVKLSTIHVDDLANGIVLATEKGQLGEVYILSGEALTRHEMLNIWGAKPGGFKVRFYLPTVVVGIQFILIAPLLRLIGLPAFLSWETVQASNSYTSSQKAQDELGWSYRSAEDAWIDVIDAEIKLKQERGTRNPIKLLKPV